MNPDLARLQPYPFERLTALKATVVPNPDLEPIALSIGEPRHPTPGFIVEALLSHLHGLSNYPTTRGTAELRNAVAAWLTRRFRLPAESIDPERHVLPVNGTREALFAFAQCVVQRDADRPLVLMPNPFYQIYEGAALLAGAEPYFLPTTDQTAYLADFGVVPDDIWRRCQLIYLCSPGNPTGAVIGAETLAKLIELAERFDFIIAADECYSELYLDEAAPPVGLLQVAARTGHRDYRRCVVFHSLSKRSNAPGLRSGFVAGDPEVISRFFLYRTYHGCAMSPPTQAASSRAWGDEAHVMQNRALYREKFQAVMDILDGVLEISLPLAGFYLWPKTPIDDTEFARGLFERKHVTVLPGTYLSRQVDDINPGANRIRIALVPPLDECVDAAGRIRDFCETL